ncbi:MAG: four helix bundle protein [Syntrophales bacterium]|nr:four helix bundle protein [Syntrophales bacterium]
MKGRKTTPDYIRMLYISYGSVCELETQILLAGDLDLIEKGVLGKLKKRYSRKRKNVKSTDLPVRARTQTGKVSKKQTLESLTPGILGPSSPTKLEKNLTLLISK